MFMARRFFLHSPFSHWHAAVSFLMSSSRQKGKEKRARDLSVVNFFVIGKKG